MLIVIVIIMKGHKKEDKAELQFSAEALQLAGQLLGAPRSGPTTEQRVARVTEQPRTVAVGKRMTRRERKKAEAESEHRTIADCITYGGNYGEEMASAKGEREARAARRKQKAEEKAKKALEKSVKGPAGEREEEEKKEASTKPAKRE